MKMNAARFCSTLLWIVAALPFFGALLNRGSEAAPQPAARAAERPALAFEQYLVNLREVEAAPEIVARFAFTNRGDAPVTIESLESSCGCLKPRLERRAYRPGESGEFLLRVETARQKPGPHEFFVVVKYRDPQPREVRLTLELVLPDVNVTLEPPALIVYQFGTEALEREIVVTDRRASPLAVTSAQSSLPLVRVRLGLREQNREGHVVQRVVVSLPGEVPAGAHHGLVTLVTDDPAYPQLRVPFQIVGVERPVN
ncbi:MAG: DUF1573 domain-containing protein [Planctomycetes bacterium]|nr:DUF1573 domain-containing protein [Planctomycetota bacterium]